MSVPIDAKMADSNQEAILLKQPAVRELRISLCFLIVHRAGGMINGDPEWRVKLRTDMVLDSLGKIRC